MKHLQGATPYPYRGGGPDGFFPPGKGKPGCAGGPRDDVESAMPLAGRKQ